MGLAVPVAQLARLGLPAPIAASTPAVCVLALACRVLGTDARAGRAARR